MLFSGLEVLLFDWSTLPFDILRHLLLTVSRRDIWKIDFVSFLVTSLLHFPSRALLPASLAHVRFATTLSLPHFISAPRVKGFRFSAICSAEVGIVWCHKNSGFERVWFRTVRKRCIFSEVCKVGRLA